MNSSLPTTTFASDDADIGNRMNRAEIRSSAWLASIFSLRMLGLFLILPVFSVYAKALPGGQSATLVGLAMGIYGLASHLVKFRSALPLTNMVARKLSSSA